MTAGIPRLPSGAVRVGANFAGTWEAAEGRRTIPVVPLLPKFRFPPSISGPVARLFDRRWREPSPDEIVAFFRRDLEDFREPQRGLVGTIPGLTPELEGDFRVGWIVERVGLRYRQIMPGLRDCKIQSFRRCESKHSDRKSYIAFRRWQALMSFPAGPLADPNGPEIYALRSLLSRHEIRLGIRGKVGRIQVLYIIALLKLLPDSFLGNGYIKSLSLVAEEFLPLSGCFYFEGHVAIDSTTLHGPKRGFISSLIHELGHGTSIRYDLDRPSFPFLPQPPYPEFCGDSVPILHPDLPSERRMRMSKAYQTLKFSGKIYAVDWREGREERIRYMIHPTKGQREFLAEHCFIYVADGPGLRRHIESLPQGSPERAAYEFVYAELRDTAFGGHEFI